MLFILYFQFYVGEKYERIYPDVRPGKRSPVILGYEKDLMEKDKTDEDMADPFCKHMIFRSAGQRLHRFPVTSEGYDHDDKHMMDLYRTEEDGGIVKMLCRAIQRREKYKRLYPDVRPGKRSPVISEGYEKDLIEEDRTDEDKVYPHSETYERKYPDVRQGKRSPTISEEYEKDFMEEYKTNEGEQDMYLTMISRPASPRREKYERRYPDVRPGKRSQIISEGYEKDLMDLCRTEHDEDMHLTMRSGPASPRHGVDEYMRTKEKEEPLRRLKSRRSSI
ncbi:uncharacterized protein LOC128554025 [Mercenaria mercenaria]|uniref:uncharacterized protein LOC128554025 n=1 Tax=Mercenaria mercenaria TaxID=6596 RepID=UPI00234F6759|nr:uncharacterized protein LOC128554025 [Mercenaria mercenaria]